jgi:hypothetical protein
MSKLDLDNDDNIWRLVTQNSERRHVNLASRQFHYDTNDDPLANNLQYQTATQKRQKQVGRQIRLLAIVVGCLSAITVGGMVKQVRRGPRTSNESLSDPQQQQQEEQGGVTRAHFSKASTLGSFPQQAEMAPATDPTPTTSKAPLERYVPIVTSETTLHELKGFRSTWDAPEGTDVPVFFNVAYQLSGARIFKDILGVCHHLTFAGEDVRPMLKTLPQDQASFTLLRQMLLLVSVASDDLLHSLFCSAATKRII